MSKPRIIRTEDKEWIRPWGPRTDVFEKRLLTKEDNFPISLTLRHIPPQKQVTSVEGYKVHSHPALEVSYMIRGRIRTYLDGVGETEVGEGTLICSPAGAKHGTIEAMEDSLLVVVYFPPYVEPEGPTEEGATSKVGDEPRIIRAEDKEWVRPWGPKSNVCEKRYLTKEDDSPFSFLLRYIPAQKELTSPEGYRLHFHPALEIGYRIRGRTRSYVEGVGVIERDEGTLACMPPGTKHGGIEATEDSLRAVINIPPLSKVPTIIEKPGGPEEG